MADSDVEEVYEVDTIRDHRMTKAGKRYEIYYLIKWLGYDEDDNTWERESNIFAKNLIVEYWDAKPMDDPERQLFEKINSKRKKPLVLPSTKTAAAAKEEKGKIEKKKSKIRENKLTDMFEKADSNRSTIASSSKQPVASKEKEAKQSKLEDIMIRKEDETALKENGEEHPSPVSEDKGKGKEKEGITPMFNHNESTTSTPRRAPEVIAAVSDDDDDDDDDDDLEEKKDTTVMPSASTSTLTASTSTPHEFGNSEDDDDYDEAEEEEEVMEIELTDDEDDNIEKAATAKIASKKEREASPASVTTTSSTASGPAVAITVSSVPAKKRVKEDGILPSKRKKSVGDYFLQQHEKKMKKLSVDDEDSTDIDVKDATKAIGLAEKQAEQIVDNKENQEKTREAAIIMDRSFEQDESRNWNTMIEKVAYIGRDTEASNFFVTVHWKDGKNSLHPLDAVKEKIPGLIIDYFIRIAE
ncbi:hypothetical protein BDF20DRAFT_874132 [Mycotypha africana]|uniref:uncharacterized protein n=1 Tax=Mycotypha africana TaxID=64632 RepID=UPI002300543A|nr:uncharacterized protein BDF20DRAFT_874132 [Mycotypha africana]KAI8977318.1 hypothetical protein BDF20DRAFT_874132 [Mycotypha africana]